MKHKELDPILWMSSSEEKVLPKLFPRKPRTLEHGRILFVVVTEIIGFPSSDPRCCSEPERSREPQTDSKSDIKATKCGKKTSVFWNRVVISFVSTTIC